MNRQTALTWSWLNILTKKRYDALIERFKSLDSALQHVDEELLKQLGCREETVFKAINRLEEFDAALYEAELAKRSLSLVSIEDAEYPSALVAIDDPPIFLYYRGDLSVLSQPCIALVGTRQMSDYGKRVTDAIVPDLVSRGIVTVSGLAYGIDAQVAAATLQAGGRTVAVLGHGLGMIYPKGNSQLATRIVESGGLLLSEFPLDTAPDTFTFPARNRIIAGLAMGTVVLEAAKDSGSLITAALALDYNKDVFAVPGAVFDPNYAGCHELIAKATAKLITCATDILQEYGIAAADSVAASPSTFKADSPQEQAIFDALTAMPQPIDDLLVKSSLEAASASAVLTILEMKGVAKNVGGGKWVRH